MCIRDSVGALASHLVKAGTRAAINTSPEPASNIVVSTAEDVTVAAVMTTAFANPWLAASIAGLLLIVGAVTVLFLLKRIRRFKARYDSWGDVYKRQVPGLRSCPVLLRSGRRHRRVAQRRHAVRFSR